MNRILPSQTLTKNRLKDTGSMILWVVCTLTIFIFEVTGQEFIPHYDESRVPKYTLPDPLTAIDSSRIKTVEQWIQLRRPELLNLFRQEIYGQMPPVDSKKIRFELLSQKENALNGKAIRKEIRVYFNAPAQEPKADLLVYIPQGAKGPVPAFLGLNFMGNHAAGQEPDITVPEYVVGSCNPPELKVNRGETSKRWPFELIVDHGYAVATMYYEEIAPDTPEAYQKRAYSTFPRELRERVGDSPGAVSTWAWGLSRCLDALISLKEIEVTKVIVMGHSRLGKTALYAAANDLRFAAAISNNSGCFGARISRRGYGETVAAINARFPHWFCPNCKKYGDKVNALPVDQHELLALIAPRPLYVASAVKDRGADPKGEFLSASAVSPVYQLFGKNGLPANVIWPPQLNTPIGDVVHYHYREGKHDVTRFDWEQYIKFADRYVK